MASAMRSSLLVVLLTGCGIAPLPAPPVALDPTAPVTPVEPPEVRGNLDGIDADGVVEGWALATSAGAASIDVVLIVDGTPVATVRADRPRDDVNTTLGTTGTHGFHAVLPAALRDGLEHVLRVYGLGAKGPEELGGSPLRFTRVLPCVTAGPKVDPTDSEFVVTLKASNGKFVAAACGGDDVGVLTADRDTAGEWEQFYVRPQADGTVSLRTSHGRLLSAEGGGGHELRANRTALGPWEAFKLEGTLTDGATISLKTGDDQHYVSASGPVVNAQATSAGATEQLTLAVLVSPVKQRKGVVHAEGRSWVDDGGPFYPLGQTLFWALSGWKNDRARLKQNLEFLSRHHYDYVRILGEVDWPGREIDPGWADYQQVLGEFIDEAYDVYGLRVELTLVGGVGDPLAIAQKVVPVINAGRQHKIMNLEVANESYGRPCTFDQMYAAGRFLRQNTPNLVAISSGEGTPAATDWRAEYIRLYLPPDAANLGTIHMDRGFGDGDWRIARQPWDWKDLPFPISHNEPIGPRSSVREEMDPLRLVMVRAVGLINGVEAFVLHNAAGVTGAVDPARNRPANLWEVPGIDGIMDAVRGLDALLPARVGDGQHWNNAWSGNPWVADPIWAEGDAWGVNRNYTVATADGWVSTEAGIKDRVTFTASRHSLVEVIDPLLGKQREVELQAGQTLTLTPVSVDSGGMGALIIIGHYR